MSNLENAIQKLANAMRLISEAGSSLEEEANTMNLTDGDSFLRQTDLLTSAERCNEYVRTLYHRLKFIKSVIKGYEKETSNGQHIAPRASRELLITKSDKFHGSTP
ncbi:hypothetical protein EBZ39_19800 [bacterium]|nr:hypothetical protein [bacterium]